MFLNSPSEAAVVITYRCTNKCKMCHTWKHPTKPEEEFKTNLLNKLPHLKFANITGGEPFLRDDIEELVNNMKKHAKRVVISTNGYFTDRIVNLAQRNQDIGIRVSIEGCAETNDELRGVQGGYEHGLATLHELRRIGLNDIGFGITVSDRNAKDMIELYRLSRTFNFEFATAVIHNSYYFHKHDNNLVQKDIVINEFKSLVNELLSTWRIKNWYRSYFNHGLINYIQKDKRLLPCGAGIDMFFLDPWGEVRPCNGMDSDAVENSMGNLNNDIFDNIWHGQQAENIREKVRTCNKNCWMIGTASPAIKKYPVRPTIWVVFNKLKNIIGLQYK